MSDIFSPTAKKIWEAIPMKYKTRILNNVWCGDCRRQTTIVKFSGQMRGRSLILEGECERCGHTVARLIENE